MSETHPHAQLAEHLGSIDIHLLDQIHKGRLIERRRVLDAGCGGGRNVVYLMRTGADVRGVDPNPEAIEQVRTIAAALRPDLAAENFQCAPIEECSFHTESADVVISNAVLHFAEDAAHFERMLRATWSFVAPGGMLFCRLASTIGIADRVTPLEHGRSRLGDGSTRFLVDLDTLLGWTERLGARLLDPIKSTNVQNLRVMTTWVLERPA